MCIWVVWHPHLHIFLCLHPLFFETSRSSTSIPFWHTYWQLSWHVVLLYCVKKLSEWTQNRRFASPQSISRDNRGRQWEEIKHRSFSSNHYGNVQIPPKDRKKFSCMKEVECCTKKLAHNFFRTESWEVSVQCRGRLAWNDPIKDAPRWCGYGARLLTRRSRDRIPAMAASLRLRRDAIE